MVSGSKIAFRHHRRHPHCYSYDLMQHDGVGDDWWCLLWQLCSWVQVLSHVLSFVMSLSLIGCERGGFDICDIVFHQRGAEKISFDDRDQSVVGTAGETGDACGGDDVEFANAA